MNESRFSNIVWDDEIDRKRKEEKKYIHPMKDFVDKFRKDSEGSPNRWIKHKSGKETDYYYVLNAKTVSFMKMDGSVYRGVEITLAYDLFGIRNRKKSYIDWKDVKDMSYEEILKENKIYFLTEKDIEEYNKLNSITKEISSQIGVQYLATDYLIHDLPDITKGLMAMIFGGAKHTILGDRKAKVIIDVVSESDEKDVYPWDIQEREESYEVPNHFYIPVFLLEKRLRVKAPINSIVEKYVYDKSLKNKLVLDKSTMDMVDLLLKKNVQFKDIIPGKGGGSTIMSCGPPGTGKTLTAEVFSHYVEKPIYSVQAAQLGTNPDTIEQRLHIILRRAERWNAILLIDEVDVYVRKRGADVIQNAIVGVFLRLIEYYNGILFMTTNRPDDIDDAIASRCVAKLNYDMPGRDQQYRLWKILSETAGFSLLDSEIEILLDNLPIISGRDIKNIIKLSRIYLGEDADILNAETVMYVKVFKPAGDY